MTFFSKSPFKQTLIIEKEIIHVLSLSSSHNLSLLIFTLVVVKSSFHYIFETIFVFYLALCFQELEERCASQCSLLSFRSIYAYAMISLNRFIRSTKKKLSWFSDLSQDRECVDDYYKLFEGFISGFQADVIELSLDNLVTSNLVSFLSKMSKK